MRVKSDAQLKEMEKNGQISSTMASEIRRHFSDEQPPLKNASCKADQVNLQSDSMTKGERALSRALGDAFGWWFEGGELVQELRPFEQRKIRVDFALPRYKIYIEVDGWQYHGEHLHDHHSDRERNLYLSSFNWLGFHVSHGQSLNTPEMVIESVSQALLYRNPYQRNELEIVSKQGPKTHWYQLTWET